MQAQPVAITVQLDPATGAITGSAMTYNLTLPDGTVIQRQQDMGAWLLDPSQSVAEVATAACAGLIDHLRSTGFDV